MSRVVEVQKASELRRDLCGKPREVVVTAASDLDAILQGGLRVGSLTEICGASGSGRTQITLQLAANVQLPRVLGGLDASCLYIDTRGALYANRYVEVIAGLRARLSGLATSQGSVTPQMREMLTTQANKSIDAFLEGTYHYAAPSVAHVVSLVASLPTLLDGCGNVRLVILNSLDPDAFPKDTRTAVLTSITRALRELATSRNIAILVVTTMRQYGGSFLAPCDQWSSALQQRVLLRGFGGDPRGATTQEGTAIFRILQEGIVNDRT